MSLKPTLWTSILSTRGALVGLAPPGADQQTFEVYRTGIAHMVINCLRISSQMWFLLIIGFTDWRATASDNYFRGMYLRAVGNATQVPLCRYHQTFPGRSARHWLIPLGCVIILPGGARDS
jgi:hypothetical protein